MLPSELKLASLGHCYVHLPETFVSRGPPIRGGAIVSIRSIQSDNELIVTWNGRLTEGEDVQLDISFAQANQFHDELVIISLVEDLMAPECSNLRVELLDSSDYGILSQHTDANLLETCRLVYPELVVPIFVSSHVKVLVKCISYEPAGSKFSKLTKWTEVIFQHNLEKLPDKENTTEEDFVIEDPVPAVSMTLGINYRPGIPLSSVLVCGERGCGKTYYLKKILAKYGRFHGQVFKCKPLRGKRPESVAKIFEELVTEAKGKLPYILALDDVDSFLENDAKHEEESGQDVLYRKRLVFQFYKMLMRLERELKSGLIVLIATCRSAKTLDERFSKAEGKELFTEIINIDSPNRGERIEILRSIIAESSQVCSALNSSDFIDIADRSAYYVPTDLKRLYERAIKSACSRSSRDFSSEPVTLVLSDFLSSFENYVPINLQSLSLQGKSSRTFEDIGGMASIKEELKRTVLLPLKYPKLYKKCSLKTQNSILLYGPSGCGKTMVAEALASEGNLSSICIRGPELLSKYIGASEAAVRDVFKRAQLARPCVIVFDEFESLVAKRGADSTGVTDRIVNQFLTILDGVESLSSEVFIVAASSRPDMIDSAMLRPGRLDKHIYCPFPDQMDRLEILKVLSKDIDLDVDCDLAYWASKLDKFTGADIQALLFSAQLRVVHESIDSSVDLLKENEPDQEFEIKVCQRHVDEAFEETKVGVYARTANLQRQFLPGSVAKVATRATLA